ncbi:MAG: hypothetical protein R2772_07280 [Chitinophagales bacterium]
MKKMLFILFFAAFSTLSFAQSSASINANFEITIEDSNNKIPEYISFNINSLPFASQESLDKFCQTFSMPYHEMHGNLALHEIRVHFNQAILNDKNIDLAALNEHFITLSKRMQIVYSNL